MDLQRCAERRRKFMDAMADGIAVFRTAPAAIRNNDVDHPWRPDSDFVFLTGFEEPEAAAVLIKEGDVRRYVLFVRPSDPEVEVWSGRRAGVVGALATFGADDAYPIGELSARLRDLMINRPRLYLEFGRDAAFEGQVTAAIEALKSEARKNLCGPWEICDPRAILWGLRLHKEAGDVADLETACGITADAFRAAMRAVRPGMSERELAAVLEFEFRRRGSPRNSFETICAGGMNATTLHYIKNDGMLADGALVLIDAGAEWGYAAADVSRTFPVNGRFEGMNRVVYQLVLDAQHAAIAAVRPGATYAQVHEAGLRVLCAGLRELKVVDEDVDAMLASGSYRPYFMHRIGHWLGLDVHDVGPYYVRNESIRLEPGMVLTIEPGLYFNETAPAHVSGIGVRIEDDVLVTADGCRILTDVPREVADIEALMSPLGAWWSDVRPL